MLLIKLGTDTMQFLKTKSHFVTTRARLCSQGEVTVCHVAKVGLIPTFSDITGDVACNVTQVRWSHEAISNFCDEG